MSVYDLYQSYLNQAKASPVMTSPVTDPNYLLYLQQQQQGGGGGDDMFTNVADPSQTNAGIYSISDAYSQLSNYLNTGGMIGGALFGPVGAIAGRGIGNLISNIRDPNTDIFGRLNEVGLAAQAQNMAQARGLSKQAAADAAAKGITGFTGYGTSQQRGAAMHGDGGGNSSGPGNDGYGGNAGTADEGFI